MWDGSGKGGEEGKRLPWLPYKTQARHRTEMWEFLPVLTVTRSASVSLSGTHMADSNKQLPISSPLVVLAAHSSGIQAYLLFCLLYVLTWDLCLCGSLCNVLYPSFFS